MIHSICPPSINKTDRHLQSKDDQEPEGQQVHWKVSYGKVSTCFTLTSLRPTIAAFKTHGIFKNLKKNWDIVIFQPDKGNDIVIFDRTAYNRGIFSIINDTSTFKLLSHDCTLIREKKLQWALRDLKKKGNLDQDVHNTIYLSGSQPAYPESTVASYSLPLLRSHVAAGAKEWRLYSQATTCQDIRSTKDAQPRAPNSTPPFRQIVSFIGTYNYNVAKCLSNILQLHIPSENVATNTSTFVCDMNAFFSMEGNFMVSFEVESIFTNIPLHRCIDLAVDCIIKGNPGIKLIAADLKRLFTLATAETHSCLRAHFRSGRR